MPKLMYDARFFHLPDDFGPASPTFSLSLLYFSIHWQGPLRSLR